MYVIWKSNEGIVLCTLVFLLDMHRYTCMYRMHNVSLRNECYVEY